MQIVVLDSLTAIYHRASGQTHVVTDPVPEILTALMAGDAELMIVADRLGLPHTADVRAVLSARLQELVAAGLVACR